MTSMPIESDMFVTSPYGPRAGGVHQGTDFGATGGSANRAVYAIRAGTVIHAGAASGYGGPDPAGWIVIDHPAEVGGGTSEYGHIIREVSVGDRVEEGQRIGRINPDWATNGGVAPHVHVSWMPRGYDPSAKRDPMTVLDGASYPDQKRKDPTPMTEPIFGIDVASYQAGIDMTQVAAEGFAFAVVKQTQGSWYLNPARNQQLDGAIAAGLEVVQYHFMEAGDAQAQIAYIKAHHRPGIPIALDWEKYKADTGMEIAPWETVRAVRDGLAGFAPSVGLYLNPEDYRAHAGGADLSDWDWVWKAAYPYDRRGYASVLYDLAPDWGWGALGNHTPEIWQFTSTATVAGLSEVDANAFRGTREQLHQLLYKAATLEEGFTMADIQEIKDYIDLRLTGPVGSDVKDIRQQLTGGRDAGEYPGWPQLGQDAQGRDLTLVDAVAALRIQLAEIAREQQEIKMLLKGAK